MREIKFRAWDKSKKCFIPSDTWAVCQTDFNAFGIMLKDWENYKEGEYFYENAQELQQFTGLRDRNGREIYDGDIVSDGSSLGVVFFNIDEAQYQVDFKPYDDCPQEMNNNNNWAEVIGNIHENPDLL